MSYSKPKDCPYDIDDAKDTALRLVYGFNPLIEDLGAADAAYHATGAFVGGRQYDSEADGEKAKGIARLLGTRELGRRRRVWARDLAREEERGRDELDLEGSRPKTERGVTALETVLAAGPVSSTVAMRAVTQLGISERNVNAAKKLAGVRTFRAGGHWFWELDRAKGRVPF